MLNCIFNLSKKVTAEMGKANIKATNSERRKHALRRHAQENFILPSLSFNMSRKKKPTLSRIS